MRLRARSSCTPPLLAGVCGVGVCAWARVSAAPRLSWLGCWGVPVCVLALLVPHHSWLWCAALVCVLGVGFWLRPATPGWGVGVCVCSCAHSAGAPPLLAGKRVVGWCAWAPASTAPCDSWLGSWSVRVRAPPVPCLSWLRCAVWVCVLGFGFPLRPATSGLGVGVCVCLRARPACTPPLLAGLSWCVCACVRSPLVPRHSWLEFVVFFFVLPGTCSCAVVRCVLCALPGFLGPGRCCCLPPVRVPWLWPGACLSGVPGPPAWCAVPRPVRSLSVLRLAFRTPWCLSPPRGLAPPALLGGCAGHAEAGREPG